MLLWHLPSVAARPGDNIPYAETPSGMCTHSCTVLYARVRGWIGGWMATHEGRCECQGNDSGFKLKKPEWMGTSGAGERERESGGGHNGP